MPRSASINFSLYRVTIALPRQGSLYNQKTREQLLEEMLGEPPSLCSHNVEWHIGNVRKLDAHGYYFAVGRTSTSRMEQWDAEKRTFVDLDYEASPYTHAVFDTRLQLVALAAKSRVSPTVRGIANRLEQLFENAMLDHDQGIRLTVDTIPDPVSFIGYIKAAHSILSFAVTFGLPNHFDADEEFQKPLQKYVQAANANEGKVTVKGSDLTPSTLVSVTKSVAAAGHAATVKLRASAGAGVSTRHLADSPAGLATPEEDFNAEEVLKAARAEYARIRGGQQQTSHGDDERN
jgi:hypothetical protein